MSVQPLAHSTCDLKDVSPLGETIRGGRDMGSKNFAAGIYRFGGLRPFERLAIRIFVDGVWMHRLWSCHRLPSRSFSIQGRQFHICARCTGIVLGLAASPLAIPIGQHAWPIFLMFVSALYIDGYTQLCQWRESNNTLRFITGFGMSFFLTPATLAGARLIHAAI